MSTLRIAVMLFSGTRRRKESSSSTARNSQQHTGFHGSKSGLSFCFGQCARGVPERSFGAAMYTGKHLPLSIHALNHMNGHRPDEVGKLYSKWILASLAAAVDVCHVLEGTLKAGVKLCGWYVLVQGDKFWVHCCGVIIQHCGSTSILGKDCRILLSSIIM